ncbi:unnamed protein product, partial [Staurois parvus]
MYISEGQKLPVCKNAVNRNKEKLFFFQIFCFFLFIAQKIKSQQRL